jgi:hypothetical protein
MWLFTQPITSDTPCSSPRSPAKIAAFQTELAVAASKHGNIKQVRALLDNAGSADSAASTMGSSEGSINKTPPNVLLDNANSAASTPLGKGSIDGSTLCTLPPTLLDNADSAVSTIFVKGSLEGSILCTLPNARNPASSVVEHPPAATIDPAIIEAIDASLSKLITTTPLIPPKVVVEEMVVEEKAPQVVPVPVPVPVPAPPPRDKFVAGDVVKMKRGSAMSAFAVLNTKDALCSVEKSERCLGDAAWGRVGTITELASKVAYSLSPA